MALGEDRLVRKSSRTPALPANQLWYDSQRMNISRTKFVILFLIFGFAFQFISNSLLGSEVRLFPGNGESFLGTGSPVAWKSAVSTIILPVKIVLIGPLLPFVEFLRQGDPPPPFFVIGFAVYWSILALVLYYLIGKIKRSKVV